ncbi:MAG: DNA methyltransferase, partial [Nitrosotalea sp.]
LYQYPMNCYEHILVFHKHRLDMTRYPCPVCGSLKVSGNTQSELGLQSWECKNLDCFERSKSNRGKRFSLKTILTQNPKNREANIINHDLIKKWRRDIVSFSPVIKINNKGENTIGHTAPFPENIPEMAVKFFSYKGDVVLDPFAGSFTTPIVANRLKRIGVGCELRKDLFAQPIKSNIHKYEMNFEEVS